jgi:succinate dehydrogenase hydrophobic anchor subunit
MFAFGGIVGMWLFDEDYGTREKARRTLLIFLILVLAPIAVPLIAIYGTWWLIIHALGEEKDV